MKRLTIDEVRKKYGIGRRTIAELIRQGRVKPERGRHGEYRFTPADVAVMRQAHERRLARFVPRLTRGTNQVLLAAAGKELVIREEGGPRRAGGRLVVDFAETRRAENALLTPEECPGVGPNFSAAGWCEAAAALEDGDPMRALEYYQRAIEIDQEYAEAYIGLCRLLIEGEQFLEAFAACEEAIVHCPDVALLHFNLGLVQEEMDKLADALDCYRNALRLDADFADAHYKAAQLLEQMGHQMARHTPQPPLPPPRQARRIDTLTGNAAAAQQVARLCRPSLS